MNVSYANLGFTRPNLNCSSADQRHDGVNAVTHVARSFPILGPDRQNYGGWMTTDYASLPSRRIGNFTKSTRLYGDCQVLFLFNFGSIRTITANDSIGPKQYLVLKSEQEC